MVRLFDRYNKDVIGHVSERAGKTLKRRIAIVVITLITYHLSLITSLAATKADADSAYVQGNYQKAIELYSDILSEGQSADVYYNLGNAYYRTEEITQAILAYERALLLSPGDADIRFNLQLARTKTIDKMVPQSEFFVVTWYRSLVNQFSVDGWAYMSLVLLAAAIILALLYLFSSPVWLRKVGFFGGVLALLLFGLANLFAWQQKQTLTHRDGAIVIQSAVPVKSTPATNGTDLFILHEGTKVFVTDDTMSDWKEIRMPDGKVGWVETSQIEII